MEGGDREISGDAIGSEDEMFDVGLIDFGFEGFDEPAVELLAGGFEFGQVGIGRFKRFTEGLSGFKDCLAVNGFAVDRSEGDGCVVACSSFESEEELNFGFGDDGID